jgi:hypothetical protein
MEYLLLSVIGLVAGVLGGLLGIGGSVVMIPAMAWIFASRGESIHQYQAAAMIVNFLLIWPAVVRHRRAKAIRMDIWRRLAPAAAAGTIAGVALSRSGLFSGANERALRVLFGAFLLYVVARNVYKLTRRKAETADPAQGDPPPGAASARAMGVGGAMGVSAGLLGIGGGALCVPALQVVLSVPLRNAIATSATTIASTAWLGAIAKNLSLGPDGSALRSLALAACLAPTAMIGSWFGGQLTHRLPTRVVRVAFVGLMLLAAYKMLTWLPPEPSQP